MISLLVDTSTSYLVCSLIKDETVLSHFHENIGKDMSSSCLTVLDRLLKDQELEVADIDVIYVAIGPGSFTGIRVGLTMVKVLAKALKKKVIPISSLELIATTEVFSKYRVPLMDARRGFVYAGVYDRALNPIMEDQYISLDDLLKKVSMGECTFISYDQIPNFSIIKPSLSIIDIIKKHKEDEGVDPHSLNPRYLKLTEAEENFGSRL